MTNLDIDRRRLSRALSAVIGLLPLLLVAVDAPAQSQEIAQSQKIAPSHDSLVTIETGQLPIILSAPHGGRDAIPGVPVRQGVEVDRFNPRVDAFTRSLTEKLADAIEKRLSRRPYVVIARFHRKYVDVNRPARLAYESGQAAVAYDAYHQALATARDEVMERWGRGILLDIHGQSSEPKAIFRGTQNGKTTNHLVQRFGREALVGHTSLFGQLAQQGLPVIPAVGEGNEDPEYNGGFIVATYGSRHSGTLDAIQLELGKELRLPNVNNVTADKLANAVAAFADDYLYVGTFRSTADFAIDNVIVTTGRDVATTSPNQTVSVGVYSDVGTGGSLRSLLGALGRFENVSVKELLTADDIRSGRLAAIDVLIQPGGSGSRQGRQLGEDGREAIRQFVGDGGGFIGICGGAYLASADYDWSLNILDAKVLDRKHWARGNGTVDIGISNAGQQLLGRKESRLSVYYGQGPLLAPANRPEIEDYQTIATYETEVAENGAPKGVMKGTTAIARGQYGNGRVICFSPHPELTEGLEYLLELAIDHVKRNNSQKAPASNRR